MFNIFATFRDIEYLGKLIMGIFASNQTFSYECVPKNNFLISQPKHMLWYSKEQTQ